MGNLHIIQEEVCVLLALKLSKLMHNIDRTNLTTAETLKGCRKLHVHSVASTGVAFQLKVRYQNCYCDGCRGNQQCQNQPYLDHWGTHVLKPVETPDQVLEPAEDDDQVPVPAENQISESDEQNAEENAHGPVLTEEETPRNKEELTVNDFIAVQFLTKRSKVCFFAKVIDIESDDICVEYLEKNDKCYQYPVREEECWHNISDIICKLPVPDVVVSGSRVKCVFQLTEQQKELLKDYKLN